jgi:hypothetical protein
MTGRRRASFRLVRRFPLVAAGGSGGVRDRARGRDAPLAVQRGERDGPSVAAHLDMTPHGRWWARTSAPGQRRRRRAMSLAWSVVSSSAMLLLSAHNLKALREMHQPQLRVSLGMKRG